MTFAALKGEAMTKWADLENDERLAVLDASCGDCEGFGRCDDQAKCEAVQRAIDELEE